jgi:hypothetical protein
VLVEVIEEDRTVVFDRLKSKSKQTILRLERTIRVFISFTSLLQEKQRVHALLSSHEI